VAAEPVSVEVLDGTAPTITLSSPADEAVYNLGQAVTASFSCTDAQPGAVTCTGTVANGQPVDTTTPGEHEFTVTAQDVAGNDAVPVTHTYTVAVRRPDGRIRLGANGATAGDGRYNLSGAGQTRTAIAARGEHATFFVTVQNDGTHREAFRVKGQPSTSKYAIQYLSGGVDITAEVRNGTYRTPVLAPGAIRTIKVVVTIGTRAPTGSQVDRLVTVGSVSDPSVKDVVRFIVRRR
jgi:hypothetical protein